MLKIAFGGYCATGGSVIRDILKEYNNVYVFPSEFRIIREKYGLLDLEESIFEDLSFENIDLAVKDFMWLCKNMARRGKYFTRHGCSYDYHTKDAFTTLYKKFIGEITDYIYPMDWHLYDFKKPFYKYLAEKIIKKYINSDVAKQSAYMLNLSYSDYSSSTKIFLDDFVNASLPSERSFHAVALHNAVPPHGTAKTLRALDLLQDCKLIIVERDPRDTFLDYPQNRYLPSKASSLEKAKAFVRSYKKIRKHQDNLMNHTKIKIVSFEDFILKPDESLCSLKDFLEVDLGKRNQNTSFFPDRSIQNIGKWKYFMSSHAEALSYISQNLGNRLYGE